MSSVAPPVPTYKLVLPREIIQRGLLSSLQLESIIYMSMRHQIILPTGERAGFLLGDGAGIGKGRQIAGVTFENYRRGRRKAVWFSASGDLADDAVSVAAPANFLPRRLPAAAVRPLRRALPPQAALRPRSLPCSQ